MKNNFRITFHDGPEGHRRKHVDVYAESFEDARRLAYQMDEAKYREYSDMMIQKIPEKPSVIGILYEYIDPGLSGRSTQPLFIKANSVAEAIQYYNKHYRNTRFDFPNHCETKENGRCTRGRIVETYFAAGVVRFDADATIEGSLDGRLQSAKAQSETVSVELGKGQQDKELC